MTTVVGLQLKEVSFHLPDYTHAPVHFTPIKSQSSQSLKAPM
jgi:hypothetical protein